MVTDTLLRFTELAPMMRELERRLMKDKSYRQLPIGQDVVRWLRALRYQGASRHTLEAYELVGARLALRYPDRQLDDFLSPVGVEELMEFLDQWGDSAESTRRQRLSILRGLFQFAVDTGRIPWSPAQAIKGPKRRRAERRAHPRDEIRRLIDAQENLRDQIALQLLARMGLRKNELRGLRLEDIDLAHSCILIRGKGRTEIVLPIIYRRLLGDLEVYVIGRGGGEHLLYPKGDPMRPMHPASVHRWFKRCLDRAGLGDFPMHELRHTAGDEMWRVTGNIVLAKELLRHRSVATTEAYLHPERADLEAGMRVVDELWPSERVRS